MLGEPVLPVMLVADVEVVLPPRAIEQRDRAVVEDPDEFLQRTAPIAPPPTDALERFERVVIREHALRPGESHEADRHAGLSIRRQLETVNLTPRERDRRRDLEAHSLIVRLRIVAANRRAPRNTILEQTHSLEKIEGARRLLESSID